MQSPSRTQRALLDFVETAAVGLHWVASDGTILRFDDAGEFVHTRCHRRWNERASVS